MQSACGTPNSKKLGAFYTPERVVSSLLHWVVRRDDDRLIDPSCGDGRFLEKHQNSVGIERDRNAAKEAMKRAPGALVHQGDFFTWVGNSNERFDCAAGNPPFIRYQLFNGITRKRARDLCSRFGVEFSALASSWPLFLAATVQVLRRGGRMAFLLPAEVGHAPYSSPLLDYCARQFSHLQIVAVREKIFPSLSEDCWVLFADGKGGKTSTIGFSVLERFEFHETPPKVQISIPLSSWSSIWNRRLRPFLMPEASRDLYERYTGEQEAARFGDLAKINIGYVSGANDFFHLRPSEIRELGIPNDFLQMTARNTKVLPPDRVSRSTVKRWIREDRATVLLRLNKDQQLPSAVRKYLCTPNAIEASRRYKCRVRTPWYAVPDVKIPHFFLSYMSGRRVSFVQNSANCSCTNSLHAVNLKNSSAVTRIRASLRSRFFQLSSEIEGHPLGGGMLKLEPREAANILIPRHSDLPAKEAQSIAEGISALQSWRHYEAV